MKKKVFVGLSGGVDSAVSAALLKKQGYEVVGVFLKVWSPEDIKCTWRDDRREAMRVAAHLQIPLVTWDLSEVYKSKVIDEMLKAYRQGFTPNPDILCNKEIKFGLFYDRAIKMGADLVATGHYAQVKDGQLLAGKDQTKDQSYFLWAVKREVWPQVIFPVGGLLKSEVRKLAKQFKLPNSDRPDSQGVCFIGKFDFKDFLKRELKPKAGQVLNESGKVIGTHDGVALYTLGERHGFLITAKTTEDKPYYVIAKDAKANTITVSQDPAKSNLARKEIELANLNWQIEESEIKPAKTYQARIRHLGELLPCQFLAPNKIIFKAARTDLSPGQSVVVYDKTKVILGGVIK